VGQDLLEQLREAIGSSYEIERELGGGMSRVFAATERALDRRVAIKLVPPELSGGVSTERFRREIQTAASLQHPHIVPLLHTGVAGDLLYYVMPLVDGISLRAHLKQQTQLSIREAVSIARQVASALDYAHRRGVIHRDIKPENILLQDGHAVVTDFGIALAVSAAGGDRITETGFSIGTPQYMSPEQAAGERVVDARTDVYALGCVLYEMLTGEPPVSGPTTPAIISRLMTEEPRPIRASRSTISPGLEAVTMQALAKLPADRFASAAEFAAALDDPAFIVPTPTRTATTKVRVSRPWYRRAPLLVAIGILLGAAVVWGLLQSGAGGGSGRSSGPVARFVMSFERGEEPSLSFYGTSFALSRDGSRLVYLGANQMMVRTRDQLRATPVPGTQAVYAPAFSPDGESVAFVTGSPGALRIVPLSGGTPTTLVNDGVLVVHVLWHPDGYLYYTDVTGSLVRVRATGGEPQIIARPDTSRGQRWLTHPAVLEDGRAVVFTVWPSGPTGSGVGPQIAATRLPTGESRILRNGMNAHAVGPDLIVFADPDYNLLAAPFDVGSLELTGQPQSLGTRVAVAPDGSAQFALAPDGTLLYASGDDATQQRTAWVSRSGQLRYVDTTWNGRIISLALSPDGKRLAVSQGDRGGTDIWVKQLDQGPLTQLTHWGSQTYRPGWAPDGKTITFVSNHDGIQKLFSVPADGSAEPTVLFAPPNGVDEGGWSPDGNWLIVRTGVGVRRDIVGIRRGTTNPVPLVATQFEEFSPAVSPDGRWLAYASQESVQPEVFVRPFPETGQAKWQVSVAGGLEPVWSRNGRELYYRNGNREIVVATIGTGRSFQVLSQKVLFRAARLYTEGFHQTYSVAPDGRFLFVEGNFESSAELIRVENWLSEVRRTVGR